jgi:LuxR family transcriptional regulator, maltose regulon positive regulatory protein
MPRSPLNGLDAGRAALDRGDWQLISTGLNNQAISERLFISEHTVHRHVANTLAKLDVSSRSAAVAQAGRLGLL